MIESFRHTKIKEPRGACILTQRVLYANISPNAKVLYGHISMLLNTNGLCLWSNVELANLTGLNAETIKRLIKQLKDCGAIKTHGIYHNNNSRNGYARIIMVTERF